MEHDILLAEYTSARAEVTERVRMLHGMLSLAVVLQLVGLVIYIWLRARFASEAELFLLFVPVVFAALAFNYQANQMTLEAVAGFSNCAREHLCKHGEVASWDAVYGGHKQGYQLTSFLKTLPLFIPLIIPFILLGVNGGMYDSTEKNILLGVDVMLFALVVFNFRYKWMR